MRDILYKLDMRAVMITLLMIAMVVAALIYGFSALSVDAHEFGAERATGWTSVFGPETVIHAESPAFEQASFGEDGDFVTSAGQTYGCNVAAHQPEDALLLECTLEHPFPEDVLDRFAMYEWHMQGGERFDVTTINWRLGEAEGRQPGLWAQSVVRTN